jgi:hypothetical protein
MRNKSKKEIGNEPPKINTENFTNGHALHKHNAAYQSEIPEELNDIVATKISRFARGFIIPENSQKKRKKGISKTKLRKR